jgi:poly(A) polymerase
MKLRELLQKLEQVHKDIGSATPYICGGTPRDRYMSRLDNISDIDVTTGDKSVDYLSQEFAQELKKQYNVTRQSMDDGHSTIFIGDLKMDFSSNFNVPNIDQILNKIGIKNPTEMQKEMFSRDFTCNSLLLSLDLKTVLDPTTRGFKDIKEKKIRTCLDPFITLTTNRNRVVRSIYLACKLQFDIDQSIIDIVRKNPEIIKISTTKSLNEKLSEAFAKDADRAAYLINQMNLWNHIPISTEIYPYYMKHTKGGL